MACWPHTTRRRLHLKPAPSFWGHAQTSDDCQRRREDFRAKLRREPDDGQLWLEYGDLLCDEVELFEPDEVVRAYSRASELLPERDLRLRLGAAYAIAGRLEEGVALMEETLSEAPRAHGFRVLANIYVLNDMYDEAKRACGEAIRLNPDSARAHYLLGESLRPESRQEAITCYRKAIQLNRDYQPAWLHLGSELLACIETVDEAIEAFRHAVALDPADGLAKVYLANAYWKAERCAEAEEWYIKAIETCPDEDEDLFKRWYQDFKEERDGKADQQP